LKDSSGEYRFVKICCNWLHAWLSKTLRACENSKHLAVKNAGQVPTGSTGIDLAASGGAGALQQLACAPQIGIASLASLKMERWGPGKRTSAAVCGAGADR
jgi:hypothetical protein